MASDVQAIVRPVLCNVCTLVYFRFQFAGPFYAVDFSFYLMFLGFLLYYTWSCELILSESQLDNNGCIIRNVNDTAYVFNEVGTK